MHMYRPDVQKFDIFKGENGLPWQFSNQDLTYIVRRYPTDEERQRMSNQHHIVVNMKITLTLGLVLMLD